MSRLGAARSQGFGRSIVIAQGLKKYPRPSAAGFRPRSSLTASKAIRLPVVITIGANDMRLRLPATSSAATSMSMYRIELECTMTCSISRAKHAAFSASSRLAGGRPTDGYPSRSSGRESSGRTTKTDGSGEA
jgi:hypothetical protein